ncbi:uncharacterized protein EV154DRAFT_576299 [Mucor mucedo]|uniref:uncharacterized protein n=1 Tax=Mucor mucedo TaxID=29922 RepID=UPI00221FD018|nr:uncharacterized protein EV154DRAFT_576299 [Mucor mucedo]KAI7879228.1 hypothetical protein EV154DRAFT_576299 [Mucor mucedo]
MKSSLIIIASSALLAATVNAASIPKRAETPCNIEDSRYFITPLRVSGDKAASYCQTLGGKLVDVDSRNSMDLTAMVNKCLASAERSVRIQTWETNNFGTNHLAMANEVGPPAVNVAPAEQELYALCATVEASEETPASASAEVAIADTPLAEAAAEVVIADTPLAEAEAAAVDTASASANPWAEKAEGSPWAQSASAPMAEASANPWAEKAEVAPLVEPASAPLVDGPGTTLAAAARK